MMNKKSFLIIGIVLFLMLAGSLCYLVFNLTRAISTESVESERYFSRLVTETADSAEFFGFMTENFTAHQKQLQMRSVTLKVLLLSDSRGLVYASPLQTGFAGLDRNGIPVVKTTSPFDKTLSSTISVHKTGSVTITAVYSLLRRDVAVFYLRNTFLVILAVTILTLITILTAKTKPAATKNADSKTKDSDNIHDDILPETDSSITKTEKINTPDSADSQISDTQTDSFDSSDIPEEDDGLYDFPEIPDQNDELSYHESVIPQTENLPQADEKQSTDVSDENVTDVDVSTSTDADQDNSKDASPGLFSKATDVCCETYLLDRLNTELSRAVETEQDIALFIVRINLLDRLDIVSRKVANYLVSQFKFRDLIFEWSKDGFAIIVSAAVFDSAMKDAELMYTEILSLLNAEGYKKRLTIGFSLRSGRILPGERFLQEAVNACEKALSEPDMPIVAFRADPDKYRTFISEK